MSRVLSPLLALAAIGLIAPAALAIPNSIIGPVVLAQSPLDGEDLTELALDPALWQDPARLPGEWRDEGRVANVEIRHLLARPNLFGHEVVLLRATHRADALESLEATFVDAGSYFGYFNPSPDPSRSRREQRAAAEAAILEKQREFAKLYQDTHAALRDSIQSAVDGRRSRTARIGHTRTLRAEMEEWRHGDLVVRLHAAEQRLVRVTIHPAPLATNGWIDREIATLSTRERLGALASSVTREPDGTTRVRGIEPIPQGMQPYCGLNTLAMAARHLGMHLDEDWLAAAGGFRNTGSAAGSNMLRLYQSVASEAGLSMNRSSSFDERTVRRAIDAGLPVIVWRRFCPDRNRLHDRFQRQLARDPAATLPDATLPAEQATWPGEEAPLHASVILGYHEERREFLFLESWTGRDTPRRMRQEELAATTYLCFVFEP